jgi:hypothetical protein
MTKWRRESAIMAANLKADAADPPWLTQRLKDNGTTAAWIQETAERRGCSPEELAALVEQDLIEREERAAKPPAFVTQGADAPAAPASTPKNGRATYAKIGRELTAIEERVWAIERQYKAALFVLRRIAKAHKQWVSISQREVGAALKCSQPTASKVLESLVKDGTLIRRPAPQRYDPRTGRYYADDYTFARFLQGATRANAV